MDILTGTGEVVTASPDQHPDLFRGFPNSYGTLGYSVRLKIQLEADQALCRVAAPAVSLGWTIWWRRWIASSTPGGYDGVPVDYLDGVVFSADESYLRVGVQTATPGPISDYTGQQIYYRSIQQTRARSTTG